MWGHSLNQLIFTHKISVAGLSCAPLKSRLPGYHILCTGSVRISVEDLDPNWIRIQQLSGMWIRIRNTDSYSDPHPHVLKGKKRLFNLYPKIVNLTL